MTEEKRQEPQEHQIYGLWVAFFINFWQGSSCIIELIGLIFIFKSQALLNQYSTNRIKKSFRDIIIMLIWLTIYNAFW